MSNASPQVTIYTKPGCPYCADAKHLLTPKKVDYVEIDISRHPAERATMIGRARGRSTVPQIFIGSTHVGGCDDLYDLDGLSQLAPLLASVGKVRNSSRNRVRGTQMFTRRLAALAAAASLPVFLAYSGATAGLGAHPWWSVSVAWIGAPIGLALAMVAVAIGLRRPPVIAAAATVLVLAGLSAHFGKAEFAASFAENGLAGRFWYFGWIGVMAALTLMLALAFWPGRPRAGR